MLEEKLLRNDESQAMLIEVSVILTFYLKVAEFAVLVAKAYIPYFVLLLHNI